MASDPKRALDEYSERFAAELRRVAPKLRDEIVEAVSKEVPDLVGPDPRLHELLSEVLSSGLSNLISAIAYRVPVDTGFAPPDAMEHARLLAEREVPLFEMLRGYQVVQRLLSRAVVESLDTIVDDRDELVGAIEAVLGHVSVQIDAAQQAATRTYSATRDAWARSRGAVISRRLRDVLEGTVNDAKTAERVLGYGVSRRHVAAIVWLDEAYPETDLMAIEHQLRGMPGVSDALLVPRDGRTLECWLGFQDRDRMDEWTALVSAADSHGRVAFGEPAAGIEGFRSSYKQALAAGRVLALAPRVPETAVVRYRDVSAVSFLAGEPVEAEAWVHAVLGDLAGAGDQRQQLRHTLYAFLEEGGNAVATGQRLFTHRNTVKYRVDRAIALLPEPIERRRVEVALALKYWEWIGS